jgi:antitoxin component of MazEF toxin-antitoxin module
MKVKVQKIGGSHGVVIPARMLLELGVKSGDSVEIAAGRTKLFVAAASPHPRAGWAAASRRLARAEKRKAPPEAD